MDSTPGRSASRAIIARLTLVLPLALPIAALVVSVSGTVQAANVKSTKTEARLISYDDETKTITVKVLSPGKKPDNRKLSMRRGKQATFKIKTRGSILVRTSVTSDGQRSSITEIPVGKALNIYWIPDEDDEDVRFARKIVATPARAAADTPETSSPHREPSSP